MKIAFMFPGQGAQYVGMGKDIYEKYEEAKQVYERASEISGIDIPKLCFEGIRSSYSGEYVKSSIEQSGNDLNKTENTQIAIAVMSLSIIEVLKKNHIKPDISVGLSLGEYSALINAGYLDFDDGIKLLQSRGYLMQNMTPKEEFAMAAVIGLESSKIEKVCEEICEKGLFVVPANYNYSNQTAISGNKDAVNKAMEKLKEIGAKKVIKLNTSGPFHTSKLEKAKDEYIKELEKIKFRKGNSKVIKNIDGKFYKDTDNMVQILANHIISPVRFDKSIKLMKDENIDLYIEIGPGKVLSGFVKKENKEANVVNISDVETLEKVINMKGGK